MARLFVDGGPPGPRLFDLEGGRVTIGRAPDNDLQIEDRTLSRYHAALAEREDGWYITDLGSHNGTSVNGSPIVASRLAPGDRIRLGKVALEFLARGQTSPRLVPPKDADWGEVTETIDAARPGGLDPAELAASVGHAEQGGGRLGQLLRLAELCVTVRSLEALFDGVVDVLGKTMGAGRIVPVLEEADLLRPYLASRHEFGQDLEAEGLNTALLERCRREGVAAASRDLGRLPSVACAPIRVGRRSHGVLYCERPGSASAFNRQDLAYLLTVAMQTGLGIENARSHQRMEQRARSLSRQLAERYSMVGESEAMQEVYRFIRKVAPTDAGVLICGESGTGKEVVARGIHSHSRRSEGPMEVVNCAAVPPALLESQLFGHVRGAFTGAVADTPGRFELADGGTLFLDEVVDLPVECQAKLLRALEEGRIRRVGDTRERGVSVRIIAATNRDPGAAVGEGRLRSDLFFRLDRLRIVLPPLRERKGDIPLLAGDFLTEFAAAMKRPAERLAPEVLRVFEAYGWPGNVRELKNAVERMVLLAEGSVLGLEHVPPDLLRAVREGPGERLEPLSEVERRHILRALESCRGNKTRAAEALGIDRSTLYARLRRYGIRS